MPIVIRCHFVWSDVIDKITPGNFHKTFFLIIALLNMRKIHSDKDDDSFHKPLERFKIVIIGGMIVWPIFKITLSQPCSYPSSAGRTCLFSSVVDYIFSIGLWNWRSLVDATSFPYTCAQWVQLVGHWTLLEVLGSNPGVATSLQIYDNGSEAWLSIPTVWNVFWSLLARHFSISWYEQMKYRKIQHEGFSVAEQ
jgi:hypothetical protein